jgi:hypothetical protein
MATPYGGNAAEKKQLPLAVVIIAAVALLAFIGWMGYRSFGPPPAPTLSAQEQSDQNYIRQLVEKTGGDYGKLSPEERQKLDQMTGGQGGRAFGAMSSTTRR